MQWHFGMNDLFGADTLEINVQNQLLVWVPLNVTQNHRLGVAFNLHVQHGSMKLLLAQTVINLVVIQFDTQRLISTTVYDCRHPTCTAQAAARTRSLDATWGCVKFHFKTPERVTRPKIDRVPYGTLHRSHTATSMKSDSC